MLRKTIVFGLALIFASNALIVLLVFSRKSTHPRLASLPTHQQSTRLCGGHVFTEEPVYAPSSSPLLCIFTSFRAKTHKIPVYTNTLYNWISLDERSRIKPILYVADDVDDNETLSTLACRLGWEVLKVPRVSAYGVPYLKEMYNHTAKLFPRCAFYGFSNGDILYTRGLVQTLVAVNKVRHKLGRTMVVGRRTNYPCCRRSLFLPDDVTLAAQQQGRLFRPDAQDYFFIASNIFPWERVRNVVIGRTGYDNYLVGIAMKHNVSVVDATNTLIGLHQTDKDGNYAGHMGPDGHFNIRVIGRFSFGLGYTNKAKFYTVRCGGNQSTIVTVHSRKNNKTISE